MHSDVIIVGAGVIGASIALELSRAGYDTVVVDKAGGVGHGSTSASSAVVRFNFSSWAGVATAWDSKFGWEKWADHLGAGSREPLARFHRSGLAMLDVDIAPHDRYLPLFDRAGIPYQVWDAARLVREIPGIEVGRFWPPARPEDARFWAAPVGQLGALYTPDAGFVSDPQLAAQNLASAAERHGARFLLRRTVTAVLHNHDCIEGVVLDGAEVVHAPIVVNAAGPWSSQLNQLAEVGGEFTVRVRPMRQEVHHVSAPPSIAAHGPAGIAIADMDLGTYMRAESGGGLLIGGTEPECDPFQWLDDPEQARPTVTKDLFDAQVMRAARRLTDLTVPDHPNGIAGVYDVADDWTPIYDKTDLPGFYVAIGTSGNQFKNAPIVGQLLHAIIEGVENGHDHDRTATKLTTRYGGHQIDLGAFSRRRTPNRGTSGTVMG
ncbi:FAD-binding oxidoreductase [Saccharopolyspora sp. ASAGF58]|uniref:NAD(P)/FAD-dependent oxidoreductase n=1 Tax=Saccharopolyspora sp. ASAGF58 TaxID=2719023 RepID=UPI00143FD039|nr:FAD-binding oxidoreductase [Saccharopolyspora sp. ASAGF58]QIZ37821.1 FAD-binding oxidoreductase [Saccharopolyspora sp. ASAGF58]